MAGLATPRRRIVLSTVSSDSHTWNLVFLQLLLEESGYQVTNLGPCVPDSEVIEAVREIRPFAVVISSVNGHGHLDGARLVRALRADRDPGVAGVLAVIGGKLGIHGTGNAELAAELSAAGFDAVLGEVAEPARALRLALDRAAPAGVAA
ncbi:hypothetical protein GCM10009738_80540 [Kitasatospora viridis]|uniref:Glutamate mutase subunit S n=1 Tax=Kitasatospora viridis TaxID=281105 RepID=A0A561UCS3_9ACTN|nr:glutamate mutase subunit S [Kitasatospora viridis]